MKYITTKHVGVSGQVTSWSLVCQLPCKLPADGYLESLTGEFTHWPLGNLIEIVDIEGILPKGPYLPYVSMAGRALLARYHRYVIFKQISVIDGWGISCEIALIWMSVDFADDQATLVQVMAWCRQATSHYLNQCWPRSLSPYGVTKPQWVNR